MDEITYTCPECNAGFINLDKEAHKDLFSNKIAVVGLIRQGAISQPTTVHMHTVVYMYIRLFHSLQAQL